MASDVFEKDKAQQDSGVAWDAAREVLEQARKVMSTLEPLEREVFRLKFGLPPEYFDEFDKIWNIEDVCVCDRRVL